jgi:hypothetical protein
MASALAARGTRRHGAATIGLRTGRGRKDPELGGGVRTYGGERAAATEWSLRSEQSGADISEHVTFPEDSTSKVREFGDEDGSEFGVSFERPLAGDQQLECGHHRASGERGGEIETESAPSRSSCRMSAVRNHRPRRAAVEFRAKSR